MPLLPQVVAEGELCNILILIPELDIWGLELSSAVRELRCSRVVEGAVVACYQRKMIVHVLKQRCPNLCKSNRGMAGSSKVMKKGADFCPLT